MAQHTSTMTRCHHRHLIVWDYAKTDFSVPSDENPLPIGFQVIQVAPADGARSVARDSEVSASLNGPSISTR